MLLSNMPVMTKFIMFVLLFRFAYCSMWAGDTECIFWNQMLMPTAASETSGRRFLAGSLAGQLSAPRFPDSFLP